MRGLRSRFGRMIRVGQRCASRRFMYQLVLQFAPWSDRDFDALVRLEDELESVVRAGEVDGHDWGSNEANIFILTEDPATVLQSCMPVIAEAGLMPSFSAGCRLLAEEAYARLWPAGDAAPFSVT